jgi:hypothetical protein
VKSLPLNELQGEMLCMCLQLQSICDVRFQLFQDFCNILAVTIVRNRHTCLYIIHDTVYSEA